MMMTMINGWRALELGSVGGKLIFGGCSRACRRTLGSVGGGKSKGWTDACLFEGGHFTAGGYTGEAP
jgi:hypothetical protein